MAEILGRGLPVIEIDSVDDVANIIRTYNLDVFATGAEPEHIATTWNDHPDLMPSCLANRYQNSAENFSTRNIRTAVYTRLYEESVSSNPGTALKLWKFKPCAV